MRGRSAPQAREVGMQAARSAARSAPQAREVSSIVDDVYVVALVLGAGQGRRLGSETPKALQLVAGRSLIHWAVSGLARAPNVDAVLCVVPAGAADPLSALRSGWPERPVLLDPVAGGAARQDSVRAGLDALVAAGDPHPEWVLVHDAARCFVEPADAEAVLAAARDTGTGAAIPVIDVPDTVKEIEAGRVAGTLSRDRLALAQTPQAFRCDLLREALDKAARDGFRGTDCASLVERLGVPVAVVPGRRDNWKLTHAGDLERAEAQLRARASAEARS